MELSVVILNYNVRYFLELCLQSVHAATKNMNAEIIVVDNNSSDGSCDMVKKKFPEVVLIENDQNLGFSKGNNIGVDQANGEYVCILNPDTVVSETIFEELLIFAKTKADLGIIGCKLIDGTGHFLPESKRCVPTVKVSLQKILGNSNNYYANHIHENDIAEVDILVGAFMFMKRDVYNDLGGFDEDYFMYGEDIDLSYRSKKQGYLNYYYGKATAIHYKGESTLKDVTYAKRFFGAMQIFYKKHFSSNVLFDLFVWFGIKLAYIYRREQKPVPKEIKTYYLLTEHKWETLEQKLKSQLEYISEVKSLNEDAELIFDAQSNTFSDIITHIEKLKDKKLSFKILPKEVHYIIGSNYSFAKGEVVKF